MDPHSSLRNPDFRFLYHSSAVFYHQNYLIVQHGCWSSRHHTHSTGRRKKEWKDIPLEAAPFKESSSRTHTTVLFIYHIEFGWMYSQFPIVGILLVRKKGKWLIGRQIVNCLNNFYKYFINTWKNTSFNDSTSLLNQRSWIWGSFPHERPAGPLPNQWLPPAGVN